jgi:hypothetical protein
MGAIIFVLYGLYIILFLLFGVQVPAIVWLIKKMPVSWIFLGAKSVSSIGTDGVNFVYLLVLVLLFCVQGLHVWQLETRNVKFDTPRWNLAALAICALMVPVSFLTVDFQKPWMLPLFSVLLMIFACYGTFRKYAWSWLIWIPFFVLEGVFSIPVDKDELGFARWTMATNFLLAGMSVYGWLEWRKQDEQEDLVARAA